MRRWISGTATAAALLLGAAVAAADADAWRRAGAEAVGRARALRPASSPAKNVVLMVGDGMGLTTVVAARILEGQQRGETGEESQLSFERLPHLALAKTYNIDQQTPDSAGTMTAMVTGVKTRAGVISLDEGAMRGRAEGAEGHRVPTLLERAERRGLATGVVTTTTVTHATPAACYAHSPERLWENDSALPVEARDAGFPDIARQLIEFSVGDGIEVVLGGGRRHFLPQEKADPERPELTGRRLDGRDLSAEWRSRRPGSAYVWTRDQLAAVDRAGTDHLLGLFAPDHMSFEADRSRDAAGEPSLSEMTAAALDLLERDPDGFFLMVEGGRIDHGHHAGNAYRSLTDAIEFSRAVQVVLDRTDPDATLVVVTADHGHVFTIGGYPTRGNDILGKVVSNGPNGLPAREYARDALGLPYTTLGYQNGPGYAGPSSVLPQQAGRHHRLGEPEPIARGKPDPETAAGGRPDLSTVYTDDPGYLQEAAVPLRSETHSAEDVPVYAGGPGSHLFHGVQEQSNLYHLMVAALGWNDTPE